MNGISDVEYLLTLPKPGEIPAGRVVVHNHVRPTRKLGSRGFRAFLAAADDPLLESCDCGWAAELGDHYRVRRHELRRGDEAG